MWTIINEYNVVVDAMESFSYCMKRLRDLQEEGRLVRKVWADRPVIGEVYHA